MTRLIVVLLAFAVAACAPEEEEESTAAASPVEVQVAVVHRGEAIDWVRATGETEALSSLRLASPAAGRVTFLTALPGDRLAAGAVAARVLPAENEAALNGLAVLERQRDVREEEHSRTETLRRRIETRDIALRAPFNAVVAERLHNPGEQVAANDVLLELFDPGSLYVLAQVPLQDAVRIRPGMQVEVQSAGGGGGGHVAAVLAAVTPQALSVPVRVTLDAPLPSSLLHSPVECRIAVEHRTDTLLIPRSALLSSAVTKRGSVMVAVGKRAERRAVRLGLRAGDEVEVLAGLAAGDVVLRAGQFGLAEGSEIRWQESARP